MSPSHDGRYAPSPTGALHLGNLRTALLAWLFARSQGGRFLLRIEDLDRDRSRPEHERGQLADLAALGIDWDGEPLRQSNRAGLYGRAVGRLREQGLIYECYCSRREIREAPSAPHGELPEGAYPGTCRELSKDERAERRAAGREPALRVRATGERVHFHDRFAGPCSGPLDDFVVRRSDGTCAYNLAVVVDDAAQGIGEVVRGRDLLQTTPRQVWLAERLDLEPIRSWAHVPLILGPDGERLAKRHGAVTLADRRERGETVEQVLGFLAASAGLCVAGEQAAARELLDRFDPGLLRAEDTVLDATAGALGSGSRR